VQHWETLHKTHIVVRLNMADHSDTLEVLTLRNLQLPLPAANNLLNKWTVFRIVV